MQGTFLNEKLKILHFIAVQTHPYSSAMGTSLDQINEIASQSPEIKSLLWLKV